MSTGPVSGAGIAITLPADKVVFWSTVVQSSANQFIQLKDANGTIVFTAQGASSSGGTLTQVGEGFFQVPSTAGGYTVWLGTNGGQKWSSVLWDQGTITASGTDYMGRYIFGSEDSTDNDFNDTLLQMQWFQYLG